jgi:hypothetical protein
MAVMYATSGGPLLLIYVVLIVVNLVGAWRVFEKAGQPGWGILVPIYNVYLMCKIAGRPGYWLILFLIPIVNIVVTFILAMDIAKAFSRSAAFGFGLWILGFIFIPILGFGPAQYAAPARVNAW